MRTLASFQTPRPSKNKTGTTPQIGNPSGIAITIRKFMGNLQPRPARRRRLPTLQTRSPSKNKTVRTAQTGTWNAKWSTSVQFMGLVSVSGCAASLHAGRRAPR
jgi:hypothetical protein